MLLSDDLDDDHRPDHVDLLVAAAITLIALLILFWPGTARAGEIPKHKAVACLIGEGESEGPQGMAAIAHALRNRGTTLGVYGCTSKRVKQRLYSSKILVQAIKAWEESAHTPDPTRGADHWLSKEDLKHGNSWVAFCDQTAVIKNHTFFKCP